MLTVVVHDKPEPQGSHIAVVSRSTGKPFIKRANEKSEKTWRGRVAEETAGARGDRPPLEGPVVLAVTFTMPKPLSAPKRKRTWPVRKPDLDKLLRAVFDGLKAGGAYKDDAQVVEILRLAKDFPDPEAPGAVPGSDPRIMTRLAGTDGDILDAPGAVIRVAGIEEFLGGTCAR